MIAFWKLLEKKHGFPFTFKGYHYSHISPNHPECTHWNIKNTPQARKKHKLFFLSLQPAVVVGTFLCMTIYTGMVFFFKYL